MKVNKILILLLPLFISLFWVSPISAKVVDIKNGSYVLAKGEVIDDDLFVAAQDVTINGEVKGDLFIGSGTVTIAGKVDGNIFTGAGMVTLDQASVGQDLVTGAGNITLKSTNVGGGVIVAGGSINVDDKSVIVGGLTAAGGNVNLDGQVGRGVLVAGGTVVINGLVSKDVQVSAGTLSMGSKSVVGGNLTYLSGTQATINPTAKIAGSVTEFISEKNKTTQNVRIGNLNFGFLGGAANFGMKVWSFLGAILVGFMLIRFFPDLAGQVPSKIIQRPWRSLFLGLLILAMLPLLLVLLLFSIIGIPLMLVIVLIFILLSLVVKIFVALLFGGALFEIIEKKEVDSYVRFLVGLLAYFILVSLPIFGWLIGLIVYFVGLGALVDILFLKRSLSV